MSLTLGELHLRNETRPDLYHHFVASLPILCENWYLIFKSWPEKSIVICCTIAVILSLSKHIREGLLEVRFFSCLSFKIAFYQFNLDGC